MFVLTFGCGTASVATDVQHNRRSLDVETAPFPAHPVPVAWHARICDPAMTDIGDRPTSGSRRRLLLGLAGLGAGYAGLRFGIPRLVEVFAADFEFASLSDPAGFRRIEGGAISSGFDPFFGIAGAGAERARAVVTDVRTRLCDTLFGDMGASTGPGLSAGQVPVASFSDYNCPYCRVLTERLSRLESAASPRISVAWHELPLLGEGSVMAARGALAAKRQGAYIAFHQRLMRSRFQTTPGYLTEMATELGIDEQQLVVDMQSEDVATQIAETRALATIFGFIGTPALVVGRTVVQGAISEDRLNRLIDREIADGPIGACVFGACV